MSWTKNQILDFAKIVKNNKGNNTVNYNAKNYRLSSVLYVLCTYVIDTTKSSYNSASVDYPTQAYGDTVNFNVVKNDYLDMCKRYINYCNNHKKAPNYITVKNKKINFNLFAFAIAKIVVYQFEHKSYPNFVLINSKDIIVLKQVTNSSKSTTSSSTRFVSSPHDLTVGCQKLGQLNGYNCGPHALKKALEKFGINVSEKDLASVAGTTTSGTGHSGLETALAWVSKTKKVKFNHTWYNFSDLGKTQKERFKKWGELIADPNTAVVIHEGYHNGGTTTSGKSFGHYAYVRIINLTTGYIQELNSLGSKCSGVCYCGFLNDRKFSVQEQYFKEISQKSIWVIKKV